MQLVLEQGMEPGAAVEATRRGHVGEGALAVVELDRDGPELAGSDDAGAAGDTRRLRERARAVAHDTRRAVLTGDALIVLAFQSVAKAGVEDGADRVQQHEAAEQYDQPSAGSGPEICHALGPRVLRSAPDQSFAARA